MFVATEQGIALGTAGKLLTRLTAAETRGIAMIFLGTTDKFVGAHRFYEKNGFTEIKRQGASGYVPSHGRGYQVLCDPLAPD